MEKTPPVFDRLKTYKSQIFDKWLEITKSEVKASYGHDSLALINSLPLFLDQLIESLNPNSQNQFSDSKNTVSIEHGIQRAKIGNYNLDQVLAEYASLHDTVLEFLKNSGPIRVEDCAIISRSFLNATRAAATSFTVALNEQHQETEGQFKKLVEEVKDLAIFIITPDGIIQTWNDGATRLKQFTREEVIGHHYRMLYREEDRKEGRPEHNLKMVLENGRHEEQWWRIKKDGSVWWAEAILTAIYSSSGKFIGISKIVRDLTEKKRADDQIRESKEAAEAANQLKNTFVANMSHEIRTPLGAILGFSDMLKDPDLGHEEREEFVRVIDRNGKVLLRLIDDILDISKIEAGKLEIQNTQIPVRNVLPEIVALFELKARDKGLTLDLDMDSDVPEYINTDSTRLRQIVGNVIGNAVKFTSRGGIRVIAHSYKGAKNSGLEIFVSDTGPGIADEKRSRIFGEFSQADASVTRKYGGSGLGLALSRNLARELGGDLEMLDCTALLGCTFKIIIPNIVENADQSAKKKEIAGYKAAQNETASFPHLKGSKILVVEDSRDNQVLVKLLLSKVGAKVEIANNGLEGVKKATSGNYDVILMDVQMPIMDGNTATAELRSDGYKKPIVALTAHAMIEDRMRSLSAGCDDYISKPINSHELLNLLEKWVGQIHH